ncbi:MAG TPA: tetratricopeptide repeat protein [Thermoanaerobaculia bacterium]|nr:tetratricopeptide repeat protein [Thermoanaerobaculia bacterium]
MSDRLTRKEIKHDIREDSFRHSVARGFEYVATHSRMLALAGGAILLLIVVAFAVNGWLEGRQRRASEFLGRALEVAEAPVVGEGADPDDPLAPSFPDEESRAERASELFRQLQEEYGGTGAADVADVYLGRLAFEKGRIDEARQLWQGFIEEQKGHMLAAAVKTSLVALERQEGNGEAVAGELRQSLESSDGILPRDVALFELARTLEQLGRGDEARETYRRLADEFPDSPFARQAAVRMRELGEAEA